MVVPWVALLVIVLAIPMIWGKVPPNGLYGFRTPKTLSSPDIWYPANRISGIYLAIAGLVMIAAEGLLLVFGYRTDDYPWLDTVLIMVPLLAATAASFLALRKLP